MTALTSRGTTHCRNCRADGLTSVLDLGEQPLANEMAMHADQVLPRFPLHLKICPACGLGQVGEFILPDRIFGQHYPYLSSTSKTWVAHARRFALDITDELSLDSEDLVLEVASNDGYLLSEFQRLGVRTLGIEPAQNVAEIAVARGIPTVDQFFGASVATQLVAEHGHPRLVAANNVMAHVPDLHDFVEGLSTLCDDSTVITVENPSLVNLLAETQFDTIYHEHFSYLTAHSVRNVAAAHGLALVRVQHLPTHGGSNRYWLSREGARAVELSVATTLDHELGGGLFVPATWDAFAASSRTAIGGLGAWLGERRDAGRVVVAYGAAAKGNTFLNAVGAGPKDLAVAVDGSLEKQGKFLPGSGVPVHAPELLRTLPADDVLVLPWNLAGEIRTQVAALAPTAAVWVALPEMRRLS